MAVLDRASPAGSQADVSYGERTDVVNDPYRCASTIADVGLDPSEGRHESRWTVLARCGAASLRMRVAASVPCCESDDRPGEAIDMSATKVSEARWCA
jgi:hypothetical protein